MYLESRSSRIGHGVAYPTGKPTKTTKANSKNNSPFLGHLGYVFALTVSDNGFGDKREATRGREVVDGFPLGVSQCSRLVRVCLQNLGGGVLLVVLKWISEP